MKFGRWFRAREWASFFSRWWWAAVPGSGWDTLPICTDLWDAFNTYPEDTPQAIGGNPNPTAPYGDDPVSRPITAVLVTLSGY